MELHHLRYFVAVAEELSFRVAAKRLHISQPPLSRQIKTLEKELGVELLERNRNARIRLTEAGDTFLADARSVLKGVETARQHALTKARGTHGELVIAAYSSLASVVLPAWLKAFRQKFPQVTVSIVEMNGDDELTALLSGRVQLGLVADFGLMLAPEFTSRLILPAAVSAILPREHALARGTGAEIALEDLAGETFLHLPGKYTPCYSNQLPDLCRKAGFTPRAVRTVEGMNNLLAMVAAGYGIAILPDIFGQTLQPAFCRKRLRLPLPSYGLHAVWMRKSDNPLLKNFLAHGRPAAPANGVSRTNFHWHKPRAAEAELKTT